SCIIEAQGKPRRWWNIPRHGTPEPVEEAPEMRFKCTPNPSGLCMCGCGKPVAIADVTRSDRMIVKGEPIRFISGHNRKVTPIEDVEEDRGYKTPCWIWQGRIDPKGYGRLGWTLAHRLVFEREVGPIPPERELDHLCRERSCVNPEHLEPVTHKENV